MHRVAVLAFLAGAAHAGAADTSSELLARLRQRMAVNLAQLPNYTCLETIERTGRPAGSRRFELIDRLRLEVAYIGGKELYSWPRAGNFEDRPLEDLVGRGAAIGAGDFAEHARAVFSSDAPEFSWGGEREGNGRTVVRFDFPDRRPS